MMRHINSRNVIETLQTDCSNIVFVSIAITIGLVYALLMLGFSGAVGTSRFWNLPVGLMGSSLDIRDSLAGYWWFVQDSWRWPLLAVSNPNWPAGTNAELFDITPVVAIAGKLLRDIFGWSVNPYPAWVTSCFALNAIALGALVRSLDNRSLLSAIVGSAFGAMAPVVAFRFGHLALMAHWLPVLALAFYFHSKRRRFTPTVIAGFVLLTLLATGTHLYLYVMTAAVATGAALQAIMDRRATLMVGVGAMGAFLLGGLIPLWAFGLLAGSNLTHVQSYGFGIYSTNLMSLFWPQTSGLFQWTGVYYLTRGTIGGTVGQYDGFDYLGGGALFLLAIFLWHARGDLLPALRRNTGLMIALTVLVIWALSNKIYFGPYRILSYPVPHFLDVTLLSWFRSSGRFIWPVGWLLTGLAVAGGLSSVNRKWTVAVATVALVLQWVDTAPWRAKYARLFDTPPVSAFGNSANAESVTREIKAVGAVEVIPAVFCSFGKADYESPLNAAALEVELAAAKGNARMQTVYLSRQKIECTKPFPLRPVIIVRLKDSKAPPAQTGLEGKHCKEFPLASVCLADGG